MSRRGVSIPTALFFVMVAFMISTVMAARAHLDLQLSRYDGMELERELLARGASARALVELNLDDEWKEHDQDNRVVFETMESGSRFNVEGWAQADPENPLVYHVYGRAFTNNDQTSISSRVVLRRPDVEGLTFASAPIVGQFTPDSLFYKRGYDTEWKKLPPVPRMTYSDNLQLVNRGGLSGSLNNLAADERGNLYCHYIPGYDDNGIVGTIFRQKYGDFLKTGDFTGMYRAMPDYVESLGYGLRKTAFGNCVLWKYDTGKETWSALPGVPDVRYSGGRAHVVQNRIYDGGVGAIEATNEGLYTSLYRDGHDAMLRLDFGSNEWEIIQPPGGRPEAGNVEADDQGNVYATWLSSDRHSGGIYRKTVNGSNWQSIPNPPRGFFDSNDDWHGGSGRIPSASHMDVTPDGRVYTVWNAEGSANKYVIYELSDDESGQKSWKPIPPSPRFYYKDGELVTEAGSSEFVKGIAVDAEDRIIQSIKERKGTDPLAFMQGDDYIPIEKLPYKRDSRNGTSSSESGRTMEPFQAEGGGYPNGAEDRYIPVYRY